MARRFAPALTPEDIRTSKQDLRVVGICFKSMAEADKVSAFTINSSLDHTPSASCIGRQRDSGIWTAARPAALHNHCMAFVKPQLSQTISNGHGNATSCPPLPRRPRSTSVNRDTLISSWARIGRSAYREWCAQANANKHLLADRSENKLVQAGLSLLKAIEVDAMLHACIR